MDVAQTAGNQQISPRHAVIILGGDNVEVFLKVSLRQPSKFSTSIVHFIRIELGWNNFRCIRGIDVKIVLSKS